MIKLNICAARIPGMTGAQFRRYATDNHARLVKGAKSVSERIQSYLQHHVFDAGYGAAAPTWRYDSVSHICAETVDDHMAATNQREYKEVIALDEPKFADGRSVMFLMFEEEPLELPVRGLSGYRLLHYAKSREGVSAAELHACWMASHSKLLGSTPRLQSSVRRAVLNKPVTGPGGAPAYDGMGELGFVHREDAPVMVEYAARMEEALADVISREHSFFLLAETVPVWGSLY